MLVGELWRLVSERPSGFVELRAVEGGEKNQRIARNNSPSALDTLSEDFQPLDSRSRPLPMLRIPLLPLESAAPVVAAVVVEEDARAEAVAAAAPSHGALLNDANPTLFAHNRHAAVEAELPAAYAAASSEAAPLAAACTDNSEDNEDSDAEEAARIVVEALPDVARTSDAVAAAAERTFAVEDILELVVQVQKLVKILYLEYPQLVPTQLSLDSSDRESPPLPSSSAHPFSSNIPYTPDSDDTPPMQHYTPAYPHHTRPCTFSSPPRPTPSTSARSTCPFPSISESDSPPSPIRIFRGSISYTALTVSSDPAEASDPKGTTRNRSWIWILTFLLFSDMDAREMRNTSASDW